MRDSDVTRSLFVSRFTLLNDLNTCLAAPRNSQANEVHGSWQFVYVDRSLVNPQLLTYGSF